MLRLWPFFFDIAWLWPRRLSYGLFAFFIPQQIGMPKSDWRSLLSMVDNTLNDLDFLGKDWGGLVLKLVHIVKLNVSFVFWW